MTPILILTRHAKSTWDDPTLDDFDRPLNDRGRRSATALGAWLNKGGRIPQEVITSGARRTVETCERMAKGMPADTPMRRDPALYHASPDGMLGVLHTATAPTVMMIGHNPGIADFAARLVAARPDHARFSDYPTGATTIIAFDIDRWQSVGWYKGRVLDFVIPRELD